MRTLREIASYYVDRNKFNYDLDSICEDYRDILEHNRSIVIESCTNRSLNPEPNIKTIYTLRKAHKMGLIDGCPYDVTKRKTWFETYHNDKLKLIILPRSIKYNSKFVYCIFTGDYTIKNLVHITDDIADSTVMFQNLYPFNPVINERVFPIID